MTEKKISEQLKQLGSLLCQQQNSNEDATVIQHFQLLLSKCKEHFYGAVERNILLFKIKILEHIEAIKPSQSQGKMSQFESNLYRILRKKLASLNGDICNLLQEGILTLYIDLNDLREQSFSIELTDITKRLFRMLIDSMESLLRQYFVYQEYRTQRKDSQYQQESALSLRTIPTLNAQSSEENGESKLDEKWIKDIESTISLKPLSELFEWEMKKEQKNMTEGLQICRICFHQIKLNHLQKHVNTCAKKCQIRMQLEFKDLEISQLEQKLRQRFQQPCQEEITQRIEGFRKICKLILHPSRKIERKLPKRSSMGLKSEKSISEKLENQIEIYTQQYGEDSLLQQLLFCYRQRILIEKRRNNLEISSLYSDLDNQQDGEGMPEKRSSIRSRRSTQKNHTVYPKLRKQKSNFYQKPSRWKALDNSLKFINKNLSQQQQHKGHQDDNKGHQNSSHSSSSLSQKQNNEAQKENVIKMVPSKKSLSPKITKESEEGFSFEFPVKHYSSLHNFDFQESEYGQVNSNIKLKDFEILQFLGQGAFGKVYMARRKKTKDSYALKIIKISQNYEQKQLLSIKNEHEIFKKIAGDHLVKAPFSFSEHSCHVFVLDYMPGGDLSKLLEDEVYFEEEKAKFYIAEIILAIEHLHKFGIIHRDLKPENLVIDRKGHLKLTDFGLSQFQVSKKLNQSIKCGESTQSEVRSNKRKRRTAVYGVNKQKMKLIGTPDYIPPEIINQTSFSNYTIDWWSLGVMAYELIIGTRPFCADTIEEVIDNITNFNIEWPDVGSSEGMISVEAKDFIEQLLNKNFANRLGANGADELKMHPFMKDIDWVNLKSSTALFQPKRMTKVSEMVNMKQDVKLRKEVEDFMIGNENGAKELHLETVIRFDLLRSQTIENMEKKQEQTQKKLRKLNTLREISYELKENLYQ